MMLLASLGTELETVAKELLIRSLSVTMLGPESRAG